MSDMIRMKNLMNCRPVGTNDLEVMSMLLSTTDYLLSKDQTLVRKEILIC